MSISVIAARLLTAALISATLGALVFVWSIFFSQSNAYVAAITIAIACAVAFVVFFVAYLITSTPER